MKRNKEYSISKENIEKVVTEAKEGSNAEKLNIGKKHKVRNPDIERL